MAMIAGWIGSSSSSSTGGDLSTTKRLGVSTIVAALSVWGDGKCQVKVNGIVEEGPNNLLHIGFG